MSLVQGSDEWKAARVGKVTASRICDLTAKTKSGYSTSRQNYLAELVAERLTGCPTEGYQNGAMAWGLATEPQARDAYVFHKDAEVEEVGLIDHPSIHMSAASPDGLVGADGLVEIKCPLTATHIETLLGGGVPQKYVLQMQWQMACTGRQWCDFVSFDPRLPEALRLYVQRVPRDAAKITEVETEVKKFLAELSMIVRELSTRYDLQVAA
jgi:putative phage-type endonuclease